MAKGIPKRRGRGSTQQRTLPDCPQVGGGRGPHGDPQFRALGLSFQQHGGGPRARSHIRPGLSALIEDLHDRGMDKDVAVVAWGEFGRTPVLNKNAGRDHWPRVGCAFVAGGDMNHGQMIGATDSKVAEPVDRPVHFGEVHSTLYHHLGIDPNSVTLSDLSGRPHYLVDGWKPIPELVGSS